MRRIIIVILLLIAFGAGLYFTVLRESFNSISNKVSIEKAIPENASFYISFRNFSKSLKEFRGMPYNSNFAYFPFFRKNKKSIIAIDSTLNVKEAIIVAHMVNATKFDFIWLLPKSSNQFKLSSNKVNVLGKSISYDESNNMFQLEFETFYAITFNELLLEEVLQSIESGLYWNNTSATNLGIGNAPIELNINYNKASYAVRSLFEVGSTSNNIIAQFAESSNLKVNFGKKSIQLTGATFYNDSSNHLLKILDGVNSTEFGLDKILPSNTVSFLWLAIENGGEVGIGYLDDYQTGNAHGKFGVISCKEEDQIFKRFQSLINDSIVENELYALESPFDLGSTKLKFLATSDANFLLRKGDYLLFSSNQYTLEKVIKNIDNKDVITKNLDYLKFKDYISDRSNLIYYQANDKAYNFIYPNLNKEVQKEFSTYFDVLKTFKTVGVELIAQENTFFTNAVVIHDQVKREKSLLEWECSIGEKLQGEVSFVENYKTKELEIIAQDINNKVYLIGRDGKVKWKKALNSAIIGKVKEVDLFRNKKKQYLFATKTHIYCLDRFGRIVENFPIKVPSEIVSDVMILDYDNDKKYRFFVPTKNGKVYGYSNLGRRLGYSWPISVGKLRGDIRYFKNAGKDYIMTVNQKNQIRLFNRKGENRINPIQLDDEICSNGYLDFSKNATIVFGTTLGEITRVDLGSRKVVQSKIEGFDGLSNLVYSDFDEYKGKEFLLVGAHSIAFMKEDSLMFNYRTNQELNKNVQIEYSNETQESIVAFMAENQEKIFLLNQYGFVKDGFPVYGNKGYDLKFRKNGKGLLCTYDKFGKVFLYRVN